MRVVVGEDQLLTRTGIVRILTSSGHEVVGEAGTLPELLKVARETRPDVVIADIRMPPHHTDEGLVAAATIRTEQPGTAVMLLSQYVEADYVVDLLARGEGGLGYLLKDRVLDPNAFCRDVLRVAAGECVVDPSLIEALVRRPQARDQLSALTPREREVLEQLARGRTNNGIAAELFLSERTVEVHIKQVFAKLGLPDDPTVNKRVLAVLTYLGAHLPASEDA
jgi:serine/threonine-protein kinase